MKIVQTDGAPKAIGPYSQAVEANGFVFVSGQIPLDPQTGQLVDGDIKKQTKRVFENIKAILAAAGCDLSNVVKVTVFTNDISNFTSINEVYSEYFNAHKPARSFVEVSALPRNAQVEIEVIAVKEAKS
ncbi:dfrA [Pseudothermotoga hypogea DSM 11164 = NBRC 106472]|uniref:DfrA n=4 Tax=Pseudothermotoga TaxID=1643951 RepID=A0A0X1KRS9_9THEM|nr:RidA family protein [Pseudothermotoga hypogea]AJC73982.1 dfrA [Pseudothermotoga hypogea DSM 11164 = NBRC 106472]MBC7121717.1 RidA family protein [Pseudothermotoga sp.]